MKRKYLSVITISMAALLLGSCQGYKVYSIRSKPNRAVVGGVLYALPLTHIRVAVAMEHTDYSEAPYAPYAAELLGLQGVGTDSVYAMRSIEISTYNMADPTAYYYVAPGHTAISVDARGLLQSVGMKTERSVDLVANPAEASDSPSMTLFRKVVQQPVYNLYDRVDTFYTRYDQPGKPTLLTLRKDTRSPRQRAIAVAEQIEELRQKKQELLFGEYEGGYDTETLRYICDQLDRQEQQLLALFVGKVTSETVVFDVTPSSDKEHIDSQTVVLCRFSPTMGLVDTSYDDAEVVYCNIRCTHPSVKTMRWVHRRTGAKRSDGYVDRHTLKYRVAESATVSVYSDRFTFNKEIKVSQFGEVTTLPYGRCKAIFDPNSGDLLYYDK